MTIIKGPGQSAFGMFGTVGIIGLGNFGRFLFDYLERDIAMFGTGLYGFDPDESRGSNCSFVSAATCDFVILAVPIPALEEVLCRVLPIMKPGGVIIDVSTVKMYSVGLLQKHATPRGIGWIATHPLFGPESYAAKGNSLHDLPLVVCEHALDKHMLKRAYDIFVRGSGMKIIRMSALEHDSTVSVDQFGIQYFGRCIEDVEGWGAKLRTQTYSSKLFHEAMRLVKGDEKLFWWVYEYNPYCREFVEHVEQKVMMMRERRNALSP